MVVVALVLFALLAMPAYASLEPMSWGFPQMIQNSSLVNIENMFAWQNSFEDTDISFPTSGFSDLGIGTFPKISQVSGNVQLMSSFKFSQQVETSQFSYPWISIGYSPVPSMGFL